MTNHILILDYFCKLVNRANDVVLGLYNETNCWNNQLDEKMHEEMLQRAHTVMPSLKVTWRD